MLMPALPAIASTADRMGIPVICSSPQGVQEHVVLAAMSVSWTKVGYNAGLLGARILKGAKPRTFPTTSRRRPTMRRDQRKRLKAMGKTLPAALADCNCVVE